MCVCVATVCRLEVEDEIISTTLIVACQSSYVNNDSQKPGYVTCKMIEQVRVCDVQDASFSDLQDGLGT